VDNASSFNMNQGQLKLILFYNINPIPLILRVTILKFVITVRIGQVDCFLLAKNSWRNEIDLIIWQL